MTFDRTLTGWQSRPRPRPIVLEGRWCRLEPLDANRHGDDLYAASMGDGAAERFRWLFESPQERPDFDHWIQAASQSVDPLFFAVVDIASGRCEGRQALMRIVPEHGVIELGSILWGPRMARSRVATEALQLCAAHVFEQLGYRRFEWKCNSENAPSREAALRFGFQFEGVFRQHMVVKGASRDTAWYAMTDADWAHERAVYAAWLSPDNFDALGQQRRSLATVREWLAGSVAIPAGAERRALERDAHSEEKCV